MRTEQTMRKFTRRAALLLGIMMLTILAFPGKVWAETITLTSGTGEVSI